MTWRARFCCLTGLPALANGPVAHAEGPPYRFKVGQSRWRQVQTELGARPDQETRGGALSYKVKTAAAYGFTLEPAGSLATRQRGTRALPAAHRVPGQGAAVRAPDPIPPHARNPLEPMRRFGLSTQAETPR